MDLRSFIAGIPKCELHIHLEGSLEPSLVQEIATRNGVAVPSTIVSSNDTPPYSIEPVETVKKLTYPFHDLTSFLAIYYANMSVLLKPKDFHDLVYSYLRRAAAENVIHIEAFFDPQAHTSRNVPFGTVIEGLVSGIRAARSDFGISAKLIMCFLRDRPVDEAIETLIKAHETYAIWGDDIIGVGLDSDEKDNPPWKFAEVFQKARQLFPQWKVTCHCDVDQIDSIKHIRSCIEDIRVDRIDHGTNIVEDDALVEAVRSRRLGMTCCPISNSVVSEGGKGNEILMLLKRGLLVTLASDDPSYFGGYINENVLWLAEKMNLAKEEICRLQENAINASWVSAEQREELMKKLVDFKEANNVT